ncbi:MAG: protein kinase domain-containing protein [Pseudonocardia sp.]
MTADGLIGGRYRLHEQVGAGGMGVVWRATDELLDRPVAIKRIRLKTFDLDPPEITRQRMFREARIAAKLHHPHIVSIFDVLTVDDEPWLVLEYLPSESLTDTIGRGTLPPDQVAVIGMQIADALAAAHAKGIVHRDIKPGNVLLGTAGEVKLTDFGISRATDDVTLTTTGVVTGTPGYLSPELCRGEQGGTASDIYSLGATLYTAVEGAPPFGDSQDNVLHLIRRIASQPAPPSKHAGPLAPVFDRLLDGEPATRPDAVTVRELLRPIADGTAIPPTMVSGSARGPAYPGPAPPPNSWNHRRRRRLIAGTIIAALALTTTLVIGTGRTGDSTTVAPVPSTQGAAPTTTATAPTGNPALQADPPTADPCSLIDPTPLAAYGEPELEVDFGLFSACQVAVRPVSGGIVVAIARFYPRLDPTMGLPGTVESRGDIGIGRETANDGYCQRTILLPDRTRLIVSAANYGGAAADACAVAETATETALARLTTTGIGQRPAFDARSSLASLDACALLDPGTLIAVGVDPANPTPDYGNWDCRWGYTPRVTVFPDRGDEVTATDGTPTAVAGRTVLALPGGYSNEPDTCLAQVLHRRFLASDGEQRVEKLRITFTGTGTPDELCRMATELAANAIPKLPAIS